MESAKALGEQMKCNYTANIKEVITDADLYFFTVADNAYPAILKEIPPNNGLWIHTAGSLEIDIFEGYAGRYGVMYPLQTFSKERKIDFSQVPLFIEANTMEDASFLFKVAERLSNHVMSINAEKRKYLHLAAVFACNFSNHMIALAAQILQKQGIDWRLLEPLIHETANKLSDLHPLEAQTGPAVRGDHAIMEQHLAMLKDEKIRNLYALISENIIEKKDDKLRFKEN
jgi:predicted short-subunit dehydrogenase-like oxidoreductase (DUF2520 family)